MFETEKYPLVGEAVLMAVFGAINLFWGWQRGMSSPADTFHARAFPLFVMTGMGCIMTGLLDGALLLGQGWTLRDDGVEAQYGRWVQLAVYGFVNDIMLSILYLRVSPPRYLTVLGASFIAWAVGVFAVVSSGDNLFYWFVIGFVANVVVTAASIRSCSDIPSSKFWIFPVCRLLIAAGLWVVLILAPSGKDIVTQTTTNALYAGINAVFVIAMGMSAAATFVSAKKEDADLERVRMTNGDVSLSSIAIVTSTSKAGASFNHQHAGARHMQARSRN